MPVSFRLQRYCLWALGMTADPAPPADAAGQTTERQMMVYFSEHQLLYGSDPFQKITDIQYFTPQTVGGSLRQSSASTLLWIASS